MTGLPVAIIIFAFAEYAYAKRSLRSQLSNMTGIERKHREEEALHLLFKIADSDNSGHIDPAETRNILTQLGWRGVDVSMSVKLLMSIGANLDEHGSYILTEAEFVEGMVDGTMTKQLKKLKDEQPQRGKPKGKSRSFSRKTSPHRRQKSRLRKMRDDAEKEAIIRMVVEPESGVTKTQKEVERDKISSSSSTEGPGGEYDPDKGLDMKESGAMLGVGSEIQEDGVVQTVEPAEKDNGSESGGGTQIESPPPLQEETTKIPVAATAEEQIDPSSRSYVPSPSENADTLRRQQTEQQSHEIVIMKQIRALHIQLLNSAADETVELQAKIQEKKSTLAKIRASAALVVIDSETPDNTLVADYSLTFMMDPVPLKNVTSSASTTTANVTSSASTTTAGPKKQTAPEPLITSSLRSVLPPSGQKVLNIKKTSSTLRLAKKIGKPQQKKNDERKRAAEKNAGKKLGGNLSNADKLVRWTLGRQLISNAMSVATQLLLLAHTPVSRKVFQYFHCNDIAGRHFLRAE